MSLKQLTIFDLNPGTQEHFAAPVRATDPITSVQAAEELNITDAEEVAMEAATILMVLHKDFTANEMGERGSRIRGEKGKCYLG